ncbi:MAG: phosphatase PAP2 family protein [Clostridia bacterium]|nr:phosphatase PAP2 family protein [Clostridia bacterium]
MKKQNTKNLYIAICMLILFVLWTLAVRFIDIKPIGPQGSTVGFGALNLFVHKFTGVNMWLYIVTDWLGLVPFAIVMGFGILGLVQLICRKNILKVDYSILVLGVFYVVVMAVYLLFEILVINYRPILINGNLEASYPSSTTMLVMCVMSTAIMQLNARIKSVLLSRFVTFSIIIFIAFMVIARLISGVHWFTDIIGGAILSAGLVMMYSYVSNLNIKNNR